MWTHKFLGFLFLLLSALALSSKRSNFFFTFHQIFLGVENCSELESVSNQAEETDKVRLADDNLIKTNSTKEPDNEGNILIGKNEDFVKHLHQTKQEKSEIFYSNSQVYDNDYERKLTKLEHDEHYQELEDFKNSTLIEI